MSTICKDKDIYSDNVNEAFVTYLNEDKVVGAPKAPDDTKFVSAVLSTESILGITLSDTGMTDEVIAEWGIKVNGMFIDNFLIFTVVGTGATAVTIALKDGLYKAGDVVKVSHLYKASGVDKFIDQPVTNSL